MIAVCSKVIHSADTCTVSGCIAAAIVLGDDGVDRIDGWEMHPWASRFQCGIPSLLAKTPRSTSPAIAQRKQLPRIQSVQGTHLPILPRALASQTQTPIHLGDSTGPDFHSQFSPTPFTLPALKPPALLPEAIRHTPSV